MAGSKRPAGKRLTIGFVRNESFANSYFRTLWEGVAEECARSDVDVICFAAKHIEYDHYASHNSTLVSQMHAGVIDGIVAINLIDEGVIARIPGAASLPIVTIQESRFPCVIAENYSGMRSVIEHLVTQHGRRRIAFICGTAGMKDGQERYRAYRDVVRERGLADDPQLVFHGDFNPPSGEAAVHAFLDERRVDLDAIVAANDWMAFGALRALSRRRCRVP